MRAPADDQIRARFGAAAEQFRDFARKMLAIRIDSDDAVEPALQRPGEAGSHRAALAAPHGVMKHERARVFGRGGSAVGRAVVDDDDVRQLLEASADDGADARRRIQRRDDDREALSHGHRASSLSPRVAGRGIDASAEFHGRIAEENPRLPDVRIGRHELRAHDGLAEGERRVGAEQLRRRARGPSAPADRAASVPDDAHTATAPPFGAFSKRLGHANR